MNRKCRLDWIHTGAVRTSIAIENAVTGSLRAFVGGAAHHVSRVEASGKQLPIEFFYMLSVFKALDTLAFKIEEALLGGPSSTDKYVYRYETQREDMVGGTGINKSSKQGQHFGFPVIPALTDHFHQQANCPECAASFRAWQCLVGQKWHTRTR